MSEGRIFAWTDCTDCKLAWTDLQSVHKEIEKICYRISNANIQRVQSVRIANPNALRTVLGKY